MDNKAKNDYPYTTAVFDVNGVLVQGLAVFHPNSMVPWSVYLLDSAQTPYDVQPPLFLGNFETLHEGWNIARSILGIPIEAHMLLRQEGDETDGGPTE